jgi:hypothetical protein
MTTDQFLYLLALAILSGILVGTLKAFLSRIRLKKKLKAPLLGVVLPSTQNLVSKTPSKQSQNNLKQKDNF